MKALFLYLAFLIYCTQSFQVSAIECYICSSSKTNCISKYTECDDDQETCQKKTYTENPAVEKKCTTYQDCLAERKDCEKDRSCNVYCCTDSYCNKANGLGSFAGTVATAVVISSLLLLHRN